MFDRAALAQALREQEAVVRVVICAHQGSSPREAGAAMLVWAGGQSGTIGGGTLEYEATTKARALLSCGVAHLERIALGPNLGQCCGGAVTLAYERFDQKTLRTIPETGLYTRAVAPGAPAEPPLPIHRAARLARNEGVAALRFLNGWLAEPVAPPRRPLWIWGAGHVGRALVSTLSPLPDVAITWIDTADTRFPQYCPADVARRIAANPVQIVADAPPNGEHLILTYSHALDLELCHQLLRHGFATCGLIGSASKWVRFRNRLQALGHDPAQTARIRCPIGDPSLGKHPQAIAISVAAALLSQPSVARLREIAR